MAAVSSQKSAEVQNVPVPFFQPPAPSPEVVNPFMAPFPVIWLGHLGIKSDVAKVILKLGHNIITIVLKFTPFSNTNSFSIWGKFFLSRFRFKKLLKI